MLCLANSYAKGVTGVRPELAEMIVSLLNEGFAPPLRRLGSIGQGDLGPMADLAHGLITRTGFEVAENEGSPWSAATPSPRRGPAWPPPTRRPCWRCSTWRARSTWRRSAPTWPP